MSTKADVDRLQVIREALTVERRALEMSQGELAKIISAGQGSISEWERGYKDPSVLNFLGWARALGYDVRLIPIGEGVY